MQYPLYALQPLQMYVIFLFREGYPMCDLQSSGLCDISKYSVGYRMESFIISLIILNVYRFPPFLYLFRSVNYSNQETCLRSSGSLT